MIQEHLAVPFETEVLGVPVVVRKVDLRSSGIVAICHRGRLRQVIGILDLPLPDPAPDELIATKRPKDYDPAVALLWIYRGWRYRRVRSSSSRSR